MNSKKELIILLAPENVQEGLAEVLFQRGLVEVHRLDGAFLIGEPQKLPEDLFVQGSD